MVSTYVDLVFSEGVNVHLKQVLLKEVLIKTEEFIEPNMGVQALRAKKELI